MQYEVLADPAEVAARAAALIAEEARKVVAARGRFSLAVSGGSTPSLMLSALVNEDVPWSKVDLFQVDERIAPEGNSDRNLTHLQERLLSKVALSASQLHAMPVNASDPEAATNAYFQSLTKVTGTLPVIDLVHLGLGPDGHTASLIPGDDVLNVNDRDVALTGLYQGHRRMTLTYPILNRSRKIMWVVTGKEKAEPLLQLHNADPLIPAGKICQDNAIVIADRPAAFLLPEEVTAEG